MGLQKNNKQTHVTCEDFFGANNWYLFKILFSLNANPNFNLNPNLAPKNVADVLHSPKQLCYLFNIFFTVYIISYDRK